MFIKSLKLANFRNYSEQQIEFDSKMNIFRGQNAQGKTNVLEAIYLLAVGKSHRTSRDVDLIQWNNDKCSITAEISSRNSQQKIALQLGSSGKRATVNGITQSKMTEFVGHFQVVLFAPEDLQLVKGGPAGRRRFIDMELGQIRVNYLYHLGQYQRVLQQRNTMLKQERCDENLLDVLNLQLVEHGAQVIRRRLEFIRDLGEFARGIYDSIAAGREQLQLAYQCSIPRLALNDEPDAKEIQSAFMTGLIEKQRTDRFQGYTTIGPHRDDLVLQLNDESVQSFASQGQQRSIALALRLAEIDFMYRELKDYPVLLLDDVLSELDDNRQTNLVLAMKEKVQTIITTTSLFGLQDKLTQHARLMNVHSGIIQLEG